MQLFYPYLRSSIWGTLCDAHCLYSQTQVTLKLGKRARVHFAMLIEIRVHLLINWPAFLDISVWIITRLSS